MSALATLRPLAYSVVLGSSGFACGSSAASPTDASSACPVAPACPSSGPPSYKNTIAPIIEQACFSCHGPGGGAGYAESTYDDVYGQRSPMLDQVASCAMPPDESAAGSMAATLTSEDRILLTAWLECGAPDN